MHALAEIDCPYHVIRRRDKLEAQERRRFRSAVTRLLGGTANDRQAHIPKPHKRKKP